MTSGQLQALFDLMERVHNLEVAATVIGIVGVLFFIGVIGAIAAVNTRTDKLGESVSARVIADVRRVNALEDRIDTLDGRLSSFVTLEKRIATLEERLKSFAALERLGIASQLGEEMIASVDTQVTTLEHEMQEKIDQLRTRQRRTLEEMRVEMEQYRANMAGLAK